MEWQGQGTAGQEGDAWVSPSGEWHSVKGLGHPMWATMEWKDQGIDFPGPWTDIYGDVTSDPEEAYADNAGRSAMDAFFGNGWIRVKKDMGVEVASLSSLPLIRKVITQMAKLSPVDMLYVDVAGQAAPVPISGSGRPNFRELNALAKQGTKRSVRAWLIRRREHGPALDRVARRNA